MFAFAPLLGPVIAAIISQIVVAYAVLVVVGEYLVLRRGVRSDRTAPLDCLSRSSATVGPRAGST